MEPGDTVPGSDTGYNRTAPPNVPWAMFPGPPISGTNFSTRKQHDPAGFGV